MFMVLTSPLILLGFKYRREKKVKLQKKYTAYCEKDLELLLKRNNRTSKQASKRVSKNVCWI